MKTIFVPVGGGESDAVVMDTALAVATPLQAHLTFTHVNVSAAEAARHAPHAAFARGPAIHSAMAELEREGTARSATADRHVREFCRKSGISLSDKPDRSHGVTASWREEQGGALARLVFYARHHDLTVVARPRKPNGLPPDRLEVLLLQSGRPLLITPAQMRVPPLDSVVVCWKESADAARALSAAMPILRHANNVHVVAVAEGGADAMSGLSELVQQLKWSDVAADYAVVSPLGRSMADTLVGAARERDAGLIVMGGYGHSQARQFIFGGCTRDMLMNTEIDTAVFMAH
jgi:nucleotide-binding universal stress UspA family protein